MRCKNIVIVAAFLFAASVAVAHPVPKQATRELIRIQGYRTATAPAGVLRQVTFAALGTEQPFAVVDWQVFGFVDAAGKNNDTEADRNRYILQGSREELARFTAARAEQRVTLLAERRQGSGDLFVLSLDLCPPQ